MAAKTDSALSLLPQILCRPMHHAPHCHFPPSVTSNRHVKRVSHSVQCHTKPTEGHNCLISTVTQMHAEQPHSGMTPDGQERHRDWCKTVKSNLMDVPKCDLQQTSMLNQDHVPHILDAIGYVGTYKATWFYFTEGRCLEEECRVPRRASDGQLRLSSIDHRPQTCSLFPLVRDDALPTPAPVTTSRPAPVPLQSGKKRMACVGPAVTPGGTPHPRSPPTRKRPDYRHNTSTKEGAGKRIQLSATGVLIFPCQTETVT